MLDSLFSASLSGEFIPSVGGFLHHLMKPWIRVFSNSGLPELFGAPRQRRYVNAPRKTFSGFMASSSFLSQLFFFNLSVYIRRNKRIGKKSQCKREIISPFTGLTVSFFCKQTGKRMLTGIGFGYHQSPGSSSWLSITGKSSNNSISAFRRQVRWVP